MPLGENIIARSGLPAFFVVDNAEAVGIDPPTIRREDDLRSWVRSLSGFQKEALVRSTRTGLTWRLVSDEGPYLNGHDAAPCPLAFLSAGMIASYMNEISALAEQQDVAIRRLRLIQDNYYTMQGSMPKRTMTGGALPIQLTVEIDCDLDDEPLSSLLGRAIRSTPVHGLVRGVHESLFTLARNGIELEPANTKPLGEPILPDLGDDFGKAEPAPSDLELMTPMGTTPEKEVEGGTHAASSSLADEQDRTLNIGATCTLRDDGIKEIIQLQYSPHGTSFRFLSEEAPINGGQGRAPDANTLVSAGFGLCFMTQFGRFGRILRLNLDHYMIAQDTHFSRGDGSGNVGTDGQADPIETHVYLTTSEDDDVAREMLDVSEQTCFLHALCRTDLDTELEIVRV